MIINNHEEKLRNAMNYFVSNTNMCHLTKLVKLLYYLDFEHYKQTGVSVTGLFYKAAPMGPLPDKLREDIIDEKPRISNYFLIHESDEGVYSFVTQFDFDENVFTRRELRILQTVAKEFNNSTAKEMIAATHEETLPWHRTLLEKGKFGKIDYNLILNQDDPFISELLTDIEERHQFIKALNGEGNSIHPQSN